MKRLSPFFKRRFAVLLVVVLCLSTPQLVSWADTEGDAAAGEAADGGIPSEGKGEDSVIEESEARENSEELKEPGQGEGEDNSTDPEVVTEPWTGTVGEDPDAVEVTGEKTTSTTEDGTEITWSGTGENGNTHAGAEGNETITNPTESFYDKEIEIEDTRAGETDKNVTIGVEIHTIGVDKDGVPKAPEGYSLKSDDGSKATYTKEGGDEWILQKTSVNQSTPNGKIISYYETSCGGKTEKWKIEKQKDSQGNVISIKTFKIVTDDQGGIVEEEVVSSSSGTIDVSKSDVAATLEEQQKPKPEDQYGEPEILEDGTLKYTKEDEETGTYYEWTVKEIRDETTGELIGWETVKSNEKTEIVPLDPAEVEQALKPQAPEGYHLSEDGLSYLMTDENGILSTWTVTEIWENDRLVGYTTVETRPEVTITKQETLNNGNKVIITREAVVTREIVEKDPEDASVNVTVGAVTEGTSHGSLRTDSLKPDMNKDPNDGVTNTTNDLFGWTDNNFYQANQSYVVTANSLDIYPDPEASAGQTPVGTKQKGEKLFITQIRVDSKNNTWGYIDKEGWVCLGYSAPVPEGEGEFSFDGKYGLSSAVAVEYTKDSNSENTSHYNVHQFIVYDAQGNPHFAYCADLSISPNKVDYGITNVEDSGYFSSEQAALINAIAVNGYWGTDSGTGSLESFKEWLVSIEYCKSTADLDWLTDGMAMAITQSAIWYYGSSRDLKVAGNPFENYINGKTDKGNNNYVSYDKLPNDIKGEKTEAAEHAQSIYNYLITESKLIKENSNNEPATDLINANSISKVEVTVGQNIKELEEATVFNTEGQNDVYNTDVTFYLDVTNSRINNDLIVKVFVAGSDEPLYTYRLQEQGDKDNPSANSRESETYGKILPNGEGGYTLKDLRLENGVEVTLEITGTQRVSRSAYLISAKGGYGHSQTFISVEEGNRSFDLKLSLKLDIEKGQAAIKKEVSSANGTETKWSWSSDSKTTYEYPDDDDDVPEGDDDDDIPEGDDDDGTPEGDDDDDTPEGDGDDDIPEGDDDDDDITVFSEDPGEEIVDEPVPLAEIPVTVELSDAILIAELPEEPVPLAEVPVTVELAEIPDMDVPLAGEPELTDLLDEDVPLSGGPELTDLFDEDVPLADVPETGDISASWYALILSAGCCLMVMRILHAIKKRR